MSIENIQDSRSLVPFNKEGSQTAVDLTKEAQATHALSMQVFQEMQAINTELQKQNTCLKVALIDSKARENAIKMLYEAKVRSLEEANESLEKSVIEMRENMTASIRITDERIKQVIAEKIEALKAVERIYEERIKEMQKMCEERVKAAEERGQSQIQAACAPLELKFKSIAMQIESIEEEELGKSRYFYNYYYTHSREDVHTHICLGQAHEYFAVKLRNILKQLRH